ncbi:hypothetical protein ACOME3_004981 [Neoechinorhynchus agilis]
MMDRHKSKCFSQKPENNKKEPLKILTKAQETSLDAPLSHLIIRLIEAPTRRLWNFAGTVSPMGLCMHDRTIESSLFIYNLPVIIGSENLRDNPIYASYGIGR